MKATDTLLLTVLLVLSLGLVSAAAQPPPAGNAQRPPVEAEHVAGNVYMLRGGGGANSSLLVGEEGALLVDSKSPEASKQITDIVAELASGPIRFLVNGHVHPDHTNGNANFGQLGVTIIAHQGVRDVLSVGQRGGPPSPSEALPTVTYGDDEGIELNLNDERVHIFHAPPAHAHENSIVHYQQANVLHLGDLYSPSRYQLIVDRLLAKRPQDRFSSASEILKWL